VDIIGPFDKTAIDKGSSGYMTGGTGWYWKHFVLNNNESVVLCTKLLDPSGRVVATGAGNYEAASGRTIQVTQEIPVKMPSLWSVDEPDLYTAKASVLMKTFK
jgi:beta-galactosidase/beta-glucuronidase